MIRRTCLDLRLGPWSDELARAGELFVVLHFNRADGMSYVRTVPASVIDRITWAPGDYEAETSYHEAVGLDDPDYDKGGRTWYAPLRCSGLDVDEADASRAVQAGDAALCGQSAGGLRAGG